MAKKRQQYSQHVWLLEPSLVNAGTALVTKLVADNFRLYKHPLRSVSHSIKHSKYIYIYIECFILCVYMYIYTHKISFVTHGQTDAYPPLSL